MDTQDRGPQVTCPHCGVLHWAHDGFVLYADGPRLEVGRVRAASGGDHTWACGACHHQVQDETVEHALAALERAHDQAVGRHGAR